jgi:hypothetical protein
MKESSRWIEGRGCWMGFHIVVSFGC